MERRILGALCLTLALASTSATVAAQDDTDAYAARAVQERHFFTTHRITAYGGVLPLDAFEKGITVGGSYTLHIDELVAWEIVHFGYSFAVPTRLRDQLAGFELMPTPFEIVEWFATTNLVLTPIYWKAAVLNDAILHGEFFFLFGGGYGHFTRSSRAAVDFGLGVRFFANETFSFLIDIRYQLFFNDTLFSNGELHDELWIGLGVAVGF